MPGFGGLWRHPDFLNLWAGETISLVGSQLSLLALPLVAVLTLQATSVQMGVLQAAQYAPFLLIGLPAGAWVDRLRRRPILIGANLGRAMLLATVPLLAFLGLLRIEHLLALAFLVGILTVFFDVAYQAFLPALVRREDLVEGNSKLEASRSFAQVAGPNLGGILVQPRLGSGGASAMRSAKGSAWSSAIRSCGPLPAAPVPGICAPLRSRRCSSSTRPAS
jgi:MFS family permease